MTEFCVQFHPERSPGIDLEWLRSAAERVGATKPLVDRFAIVPGDGYVNLMLETTDPAELWRFIRGELLGDEVHGVAFAKASMIVCQGELGWDDYRLLHHYDPEQAVDPQI